MEEIGLEEMLKLLSKEKGGTSEQYNKLMDYISFHETGPAQRMSGDAIQKGGGPGRGLFQFEIGDGKGGNIAVNRTHAYLTRNNKEIPAWLNKMWDSKKSADVSGLTADQQKMLFLGYHREHPTSNFSKIWSGEQSIQDFWLKNHWAGSGSSDQATIQEKLDLFDKSMIAKDSVDAINLRKQELFPLQDKVPFQSASSDINNVPDIQGILNKIFGAQDSSLVKKYNHGGMHLPTAESDATYVQQPQFNIPIAQEEQWVDQFGSASGSHFPAAPEPTLWEKIKNAGANPLGTFGYSARGEDIPWGKNKGD